MRLINNFTINGLWSNKTLNYIIYTNIGLIFYLFNDIMYCIFGQTPAPSVDGWVWFFIDDDQIIPEDKCGQNFLTFNLPQPLNWPDRKLNLGLLCEKQHYPYFFVSVPSPFIFLTISLHTCKIANIRNILLYIFIGFNGETIWQIGRSDLTKLWRFLRIADPKRGSCDL